MKNRTMTILLIFFLGVLAIATILMLVFLLLGKGTNLFNINSDSVLLLSEYYNQEIETIYIESISSDVMLKETEETQIHVEVYGKENEVVESKIENKTLNISKKGKIFCFGFCFFKGEIIVYVPKDILLNIEVKTTSGDIEMSSIKGNNANLKSTSGDLKLGEVNTAELYSTSGEIILEKGNNVQAKTTSGDIELNRIENHLDAESVSGDIKIRSLFIENDSKIKTTSGDVLINEINNAYIETSTVSGDVHISDNNQYARSTLNIKTISGDIRVK